MNNSHRHLLRTCANKTYFHRFKTAEQFARRVRKGGGALLRPYACDYCGGWHLTSLRPALKSNTDKEKNK